MNMEIENAIKLLEKNGYRVMSPKSLAARRKAEEKWLELKAMSFEDREKWFESGKKDAFFKELKESIL